MSLFRLNAKELVRAESVAPSLRFKLTNLDYPARLVILGKFPSLNR